ncbi:MAG: hypothetical protein HXY18_02595 [Bryobacteraceae bacterium]|nr:hypothetical protein [Bryobacteraceae bacterium]
MSRCASLGCGNRMMLALAMAGACIPGPRAAAQALPATLKGAMTGYLKFTPAEITAVEGGRAAAHIVETGDPEDVFIVGAVRVGVLPAVFVERYRNITEFESGPGIPAGGKFSTPPVEQDLSGLAFIKDEIDDIRDCKPGDCSFKIGDPGIQRIRTSVNWKSQGYVAEANKVIRGMWLEYLRNYQAKGNAALAAYHDSDKLSRVADGLTKLVKNLPVLEQYVPETADYLVRFPQSKPPSSEEFYYWQIAEFGLKPVHRVTHVIIQKKPGQFGDAYLITNKMLYASHYFRSALEFRFLIPAEGSDKKPATYLVVLQRSYVDGLTGMKGKLLRGPIMSRSRDALERYLMASKNKLEGRPAAAKK